MTKHNAHQYLPLIKALAEGKQLQFNNSDNTKWYDVTDLAFNLPVDRYRINTEPIKQEFYYILHRDNAISHQVAERVAHLYSDLSEAEEYLKNIDPNGEKYVIMHANATSMMSI